MPKLALSPDALQREMQAFSKKLIENKLQSKINSFIYPYGKMNRSLQKKVEKEYQQAYRIGGATNCIQNNVPRLLYRIDAEHFWHHNIRLSEKALSPYKRKYWLNRLRGK